MLSSPLKLAPGPGFWAQTAAALIARYPQGYTSLQVLVPAFSHAQLLKQALAAQLGHAFIAPRINTVNGWLAQHALRHEAVPPSDSARLMGLYAELRQHGWLKKLFSASRNTDLLPLADLLLTLSDELTRALLPEVIATADELDPRWEQALAQLPPPARKLLSDEAQLVWSLWKGQLDRHDKTALRQANLLALAAEATDDLVWISPVAPDGLESAFLARYAQQRPVLTVLLDWRPERVPEVYCRAWREMPEREDDEMPAEVESDTAPPAVAPAFGEPAPFDDDAPLSFGRSDLFAAADDAPLSFGLSSAADDDAPLSFGASGLSAPPEADAPLSFARQDAPLPLPAFGPALDEEAAERDVRTPAHLALLPCQSMEQEALFGAQTVLDWLAAGHKQVAIVAQDRVVTRRMRALLERAQVRVMDETGWKLSTTRAAAAIVAWLDIVATRADTVTLLDFLKSPYVCTRLHGKARQLMLLETVLRRANISGGWRAILAATARARAKHEAGAMPAPARPIRPDVHDDAHDYVRLMLAQMGFGERDSAGHGFGERGAAWREHYDFVNPAEDDPDFLRHDAADYALALDGPPAAEAEPAPAADFSEVDYVPDGAPAFDDYADVPPPDDAEAMPARSRFTLDADIAPAEMTVFTLVEHIAAQATLFTGTKPIAKWGALMADTLQLFGMAGALEGDDAGRQVLALLENLGGGHEAGTVFSFNEWRACIAGQLEATAFVAPGADPRVVMLPLNGARLRAFDAVLVAGVDSEHLPSANPETLFFANAVRRELGLETRESRQRQQMRDFCELLLANPLVVLSWQAHQDGEPNAVSPWIERLQLALARAGQPPLPRHACALGTQTLHAELSAMPAPSAGALLPAKLSASAYNTFLACPYQFFVTRMLRLSGMDELTELPEKRDYGDWLHKILKTFHESLAEDPRQDRAGLLGAITEQVFAPELSRSAAALGYYTRWQKVIPAYLDWAAARERDGWQFAYGEQAFERALTWDGGEILLAGRIDRIDRHVDGGYAVLDYKTTNATTLKTRLKNLEDQQLPFYGLLSGLQAESAHFVALELSADKHGPKTGDAPAPDYVRWQQALQQHIVRNMSAVQQGSPIPANGVASVCQYCDARGLCRKGAW
jgi:inactivated superfamily I helicase/RecB family exonuclease